MPYKNSDSLVTTDWLAAHIDDPDVRIVDASWYLPAQNRDGRTEYLERHIPGAVYWDIEEISDTSDPLPHMLPAPPVFSAHMRRLGLALGHRIVVYDGAGIFTSPRVWWTLREFGYPTVAVLDGGLPKWLAEERPVTAEIVETPLSETLAVSAPRRVRNAEDLLENLTSRNELVLDARAQARFEGTAPEPRPNCRPGHIPQSRCLPFDRLTDPSTQTMLPAEDLTARFESAGVDWRTPVVTTCGSGVTACVLAFGLHLVGYDNVAVYDGSWSDWGTRTDTPVDTGPA
jgi:thiosulfate/3-mercaptopyruvate sulfurtransferase